MKIFFFGSDYPPTGGGISTHTKEWLSALAQEGGIKVRAIIFGNKEPRTEKVGGIIELTALRSVNFFYVGYKIYREMKKYLHYDVFHSFNLFPVGFWVVFWAKYFRKKSVLTFYGADACDMYTSTKVVKMQRFALKYATWAVTISEFTKERVIGKYNLLRPIRVIHPILPTYEKGQPMDVRKKLHLDSSDFVVISVSRLAKRKGIEYLIEGISKINDSQVKLIIVGGGPERENLEKLVQKLNLSSRVIFTGKVPMLAPYYKAANIGALVSYSNPEGDFEGLGLVLLEAQSYGLPVIGSRSGGIPEAFEGGKTGLLVPEKNPDAIAAAIQKLKNDRQLYDSMSKATGEFLEREFGRENTIGMYLKMLRGWHY